MRRNSSRRLVLCGVALTACLACFWAVSATAVAAPGTFVDGPQTVHGSATGRNECNATYSPSAPLPSALDVGVTISSSAGPQPLDLGPVTLSDTTVAVSLPVSFLQPGIDDGTFADGQALPVLIAPVVAGSNTVEATHEYSETTTATIHVADGMVQPLRATVQLPDTIWHPAMSDRDIFFTEKSVRVVLAIEPLSVITETTLTADCVPSDERVFIALGSTCPVDGPCDSTSTTSPIVTFTDPTVLNQSTTVPGPNTLPRTGSRSGDAVLFGLSCIAGGALLLIRRRREVVG
jgi:LPXTG-motif cell wall-anchored protein